MKRITKYLSLMDILVYGGVIIMVIIGLFCNGCSQRIAEYNPETGVWRYKSNSFATDSSADRIVVRTPSGLEVAIERVIQENDSVKASAVVGGVPVIIESK